MCKIQGRLRYIGQSERPSGPDDVQDSPEVAYVLPFDVPGHHDGNLLYQNCMDKVVVHPFCESIQLRLDLQNQMENDNAKYILSPTNFMVWSDEDFIGRIARLSRRVHKASTAKYTIDRAKCLYLRQWRRTFE